MDDRQYYVYIMINKYNKVLYTGVTNSLFRRVSEHKGKINFGFTRRYNITKPVYYEIFENVCHAIDREKQIKSGSRKDKINLINKFNNDKKCGINFHNWYYSKLGFEP